MSSRVSSRRKKRKRPLSKLTAEDFMNYSSGEEEEGKWDQSTTLDKQELDDIEGLGSSDEEEMDVGVVEPRPLGITSYREKTAGAEETAQSSEESGEDEDGAELESDEDEDGKEDHGGGEATRRSRVTLAMVKKWAESLEESNSVYMLRKLCGSLHDAISSLLSQPHPQEDRVAPSSGPASSEVFNALVLACFGTVPNALQHHLPPAEGAKGKHPHLPSSQRAWRRVRGTVRQYLEDLLVLIGRLQSSSMQCCVLDQLQAMARYCVCFSKLLKKLVLQLVECWSGRDNHTQVKAFLGLRSLVLLQPHPALHLLLKKMYLAFVRHCKFPVGAGIPALNFMLHSLVELLALDPPTTYQHAFIYIRQLAIHLRAATTTSKKDSQQAVYNWQFVYCLKLWGVVLCEVTDKRLRPLIYPLVQVVTGTIQLQPSAKYHPLRLHLIHVLLLLADKTSTYIPIAPYLLEVLEDHGVGMEKKLLGGKAGDLSVMLRASATQLKTRQFKTTLVNESFLLLLQYFVIHSHYISFPELAFPTIVRLKAVSKSTKYSWLRSQLKQLMEKVEEISAATTQERSKVTFSPKDYDKVTSWESDRKGKETNLSRFLSTWTKLNSSMIESTVRS